MSTSVCCTADTVGHKLRFFRQATYSRQDFGSNLFLPLFFLFTASSATGTAPIRSALPGILRLHRWPQSFQGGQGTIPAPLPGYGVHPTTPGHYGTQAPILFQLLSPTHSNLSKPGSIAQLLRFEGAAAQAAQAVLLFISEYGPRCRKAPLVRTRRGLTPRLCSGSGC